MNAHLKARSRHARRICVLAIVVGAAAISAGTLHVGASPSARWSFVDAMSSSRPSGRLLGGMTTLADGNVVLYGGQKPNSGVDADTWEYTASHGWVPKCGTNLAGATAPCGPGARSLFGGLGAGPTGAVLFGGGDNNGNFYSDTWVWNGSGWHRDSARRAPADRPSSVAPAIAGNGTRVVLFGGLGPGNASDTWTFNGTTWTETCGPDVAPACGPPVLAAASMAWDGTHFVLFGGATQANGGDFGPPVDDTWIYNGTSWTHTCGASMNKPCGPRARGLAGFTPISNHNPALQGAILAGGGDLFGNTTHSLDRDAWFWHDDSWQQLAQPWPTTPVTFTDPAPPPVGTGPALGMLATEPATCAVVYQADHVTAINGNNVTVASRTYTGGWDLTGNGSPTGCDPPAAVTTSVPQSTTTTTARIVSPRTTIAKPTLPNTGTTTAALTITGIATIAVGAAMLTVNRRKPRRADLP